MKAVKSSSAKPKAPPETKKRPAAAVAVAGTSEGGGAARPAKKKAKDTTEHQQATVVAPKPVALPRINKKTTLAQLQEEASCRGIHKKEMPEKKADLLYFLVDGSIHLKEAPACKQVKQLKQQMEQERLSLEQKARARRQHEIQNQKPMHKHFYSRVHPHPLARTKDLLKDGSPRDEHYMECSVCQGGGGGGCVWTCEECDYDPGEEDDDEAVFGRNRPVSSVGDFDICETCFTNENKNFAEKARDREKVRQARLEGEQRDYEMLVTREQEAEEEEAEKRLFPWDANKQFKRSIISLLPMNKKPDGNMMKGFTVWCSEGYRNDGWHKGNDDPTQEFDSTWKTAEDANDRARYLFLWKNCWGIDPEELMGGVGDPHECCEKDGLKTFSMEPEDSGYWTVAVVPDVAFIYLPNATTCRHGHDDPPKIAQTKPSYSYF